MAKRNKKKINYRTGAEIERMREAGHLAAEILQLTAKEIRPGATTKDVDQAAAEFMQERGCRSAFLGYRGFPGNICISMNDEVVHGIGNPKRVIQMGDIVKIDVGIKKNGWIGDNAMTVPVGEIDPATQHLLYATEESLHVAIEHARAGQPLRELCASVEATVDQFNYTVVKQFVGHGVGQALHEEPQVPNYDVPEEKRMLKAGMILAIEPMVNLGTERVTILPDNWTVKTYDGKPSAHYEHTVLITDGDPEILTPRRRLIPPVAPPKQPLVEGGVFQ